MKLETKYVIVSLDELLDHLASDHYMGKMEAEAYSGLCYKTLLTFPYYQPNGGKILWRKSEIDAHMQRNRKGESPIDFDERIKELQDEFRKEQPKASKTQLRKAK